MRVSTASRACSLVTLSCLFFAYSDLLLVVGNKDEEPGLIWEVAALRRDGSQCLLLAVAALEGSLIPCPPSSDPGTAAYGSVAAVLELIDDHTCHVSSLCVWRMKLRICTFAANALSFNFYYQRVNIYHTIISPYIKLPFRPYTRSHSSDVYCCRVAVTPLR